jgi:glycerol-3-phosphate dehydrogenase
MNWPLERTGALLVAWDDEQLGRLDGIVANAAQVGYHAIERLTADRVYVAEPHLGEGVRGALRVPDEGLLDPWSITIGLATDAVVNGATLLTSAPVTGVDQRGESYVITAGRHRVDVDWVVNAAGLHSDDVDRLMGEDGFTVTPRRGQLIVFDKLARGLLQHIILPVPTATTKGVLVSPTVYGNILLGPTAEDLPDKAASQTTRSGLDGLLSMGRRILPALLDEEVTASYAGLRAATEHSDYCLALFAPKRYVRMGGIRSTGISSCLALAEAVTLELAEHTVPPAPLPAPVTVAMPNLAEARLRPYADAELIARDPAYGRVVCLCERVTGGEIRDALMSPVPARDLDGVRRRTRALAGRCQGFHCGAAVTAMLAEGGRDA